MPLPRGPPCRHPAQLSSGRHPATVVAAPWLRPMTRASRRRALLPSLGSPASPWDGSARLSHSATSSGSRRPSEGRGIGFDLVPRSPLNSVQIPPKANSGRSSFSANQTTSFFFVSGFGSGAYSAKLFAGTKQRFSGFNRPRQWGEGGVADISDGMTASARGRRHSPAHHDQFTFSACLAHDGRRIVGKHARHRRQVAEVPIHHAEQRNDGGLVMRAEALSLLLK